MKMDNNKLYKYPNILEVSSFKTVSMIPSDFKVAGCFDSLYNIGGLIYNERV